MSTTSKGKMFSYISKRMNISVAISIVMPVQSQREYYGAEEPATP